MSKVLQVHDSFELEELGSYDNDNDNEEGSISTDTGKVASRTEDTGETSSSLQEQLAKRESEIVFRLRVLVVMVLVLAGAAVSLVIFFVARSGENEEFEGQYKAATEKIMESFADILTSLGSVSGLGVALTATSVDNAMVYPFVTLSNFQQRAENARHLSASLFVGFSPLVERKDFEAWDEYVSGENTQWIEEARERQQRLGQSGFEAEDNIRKSMLTHRTVDLMHYFDQDGYAIREEDPEGPYLPLWQTSPYLETRLVNANMLRDPKENSVLLDVLNTSKARLGPFMLAPSGNTSDNNSRTALFATLMSISAGHEVPYKGDPVSKLYIPLFDQFNVTKRKVVGVMSSVIHWRSHFHKMLPSNVNGIDVILHYECNGINGTLVRDAAKNGATNHQLYSLDSFTYQIHGPEANVIGYADHHEKKFQDWERRMDFTDDNLVDGTESGIHVDMTCQYHIHLFPTQMFYDSYHTSTPIALTFSMVAVFLFAIGMFYCYDRCVERRQMIVLAKAKQSTAVVASLFPKAVRDRLLQTEHDTKNGSVYTTNKHRLKGFIDGANNEGQHPSSDSQPIADLFPHCTVFFADIQGFTAWASTREPSEVFILLQSLYQAFDVLAHRRRVFKVETVGDAYVAVTGLPEPQEKHALTMVRFAWDCLIKVSEITTGLESTLGPGTGNLGMRFGLHSGPVIAGVLRGDRARFQLFGDTVNTASRIESTGVCGRIQVSQTTAGILKNSGKGHWLTLREDCVAAKGKGVLQTYFVNPTSQKGSSVTSGDSTSESNSPVFEPVFKPSEQRLVEWVMELFVKDIRKIIHARIHKKIHPLGDGKHLVYYPPEGTICLDEVKRAIPMPEYNAAIAACTSPHDEIVVDELTMEQLRTFVTAIARMYRNNAFHSFDHCCHVTMGCKRLIGRVIAPELTQAQIESLTNSKKCAEIDLHCHIHELTYGIKSEPLALLALTFSALIHDVDHRGVSNMQLSMEDPQLAEQYRRTSVAEQHSMTLAWNLFMEDRFSDLRKCIFASQEELLYFRQLVVNMVLATDIFDKDLNATRRSRWEEAFSTATFDSDLRATIVLEHIMQASDVSHTMQHWHVYQKWNQCLFHEMHAAFKAGRLAKDPSTFWFKGELGFFDNYIIPLAHKLKECNVFGVYSDEYLNYALQNRAEWEERGKDLVAEMVSKFSLESL